MVLSLDGEYLGETLQQSVPTPHDVQATFCGTLFDEWISLGLRDVVICPGSRSTPLTLAASKRKELRVHVRLDERSAAFFALGVALESGRPVAVVVTSGTAAAELHAAVAEADQAFVPLLILTADRPEELHGVGAPQTITQSNLYGPMVRMFIEPGVPAFEARSTWRQLAREGYETARGGVPGPVHYNIAFREPLVGTELDFPEPLAPAETSVKATVPSEDIAASRVLCIVGSGTSPETVNELVSNGWTVLGDVTTPHTLSYFDPLLRSLQFRDAVKPDIVLRFGGLAASKILQETLRSWSVPVWAVGERFVADPDRLISKGVEAVPHSTVASDDSYANLWREASKRVGEWLEISMTPQALLSEPLVAHRITTHANRSQSRLVVGSSMPVRDVEWWGETRRVPTFSNRGVNGIDGVLSTIFGVAQGGSTIGYVGDLTFLHDVSGLVEATGKSPHACVVVVSDNRGGGIFNFLSQAQHLDEPSFEELFGTPRQHDIATVAGAFGYQSIDVHSLNELDEAVDNGLGRAGLTVIVAHMPSRSTNVHLHDQWNKEVADLIEGLL